MSNQTLLNQFKAALFAVLDETFTPQHYGIYLDKDTSLFQTLEGISAEVASRPVSESCAAIATQVEHVIFYLDVLEAYVLNKEIGPVDWDEIWREAKPVTTEEWSALRQRLQETFERARVTLEGIQTWEGENEIGGALGIVVHTAYHLGEIRQALCTVE